MLEPNLNLLQEFEITCCLPMLTAARSHRSQFVVLLFARSQRRNPLRGLPKLLSANKRVGDTPALAGMHFACQLSASGKRFTNGWRRIRNSETGVMRALT